MLMKNYVISAFCELDLMPRFTAVVQASSLIAAVMQAAEELPQNVNFDEVIVSEEI